jgi:hypothetical protein
VTESKRMRMVGYVARMGQRRFQHRDFMEKADGKSPLGRQRHRWEVNI